MHTHECTRTLFMDVSVYVCVWSYLSVALCVCLSTWVSLCISICICICLIIPSTSCKISFVSLLDIFQYQEAIYLKMWLQQQIPYLSSVTLTRDIVHSTTDAGSVVLTGTYLSQGVYVQCMFVCMYAYMWLCMWLHVSGFVCVFVCLCMWPYPLNSSSYFCHSNAKKMG